MTKIVMTLLFCLRHCVTSRKGWRRPAGPGKQAKCISIKVRYADFTTITRQRTLLQTTDLDQIIFQTGNELLQKAVADNRLAIRLIGIGVSNLSEPGMQLSLMNGTEQRLEKLNRAVDRIQRSNMGFTAIQTGRTMQLKSPH